ncbi:MAG: glycosyltransferase family 2 protein [Bacteroidetes bacterium]|nr:glycosyltransferase family 2 protein [Bacteroidota bacterium]
MQKRVSAIVIHFGDPSLTTALVRQLLALPSAPEVIVVDNAAAIPFDADPYDGIRLLRLPENAGYGYACNRGAEMAEGDFLFILNNDLIFPADPIPALVKALEGTEHAAIAGPALSFPDGRFQLSSGEQPTLYNEFLERRRQQQSRGSGGAAYDRRRKQAMQAFEPYWVTGACMLIRRAAWQQVSGFDEAYFFYFEDVDLCTRLRRAGWTILYQPEVTVLHHGGGSDPLHNPRIVLSYRREQLRYYARYNGLLSWLFLRRYLLWKCSRMERAAQISPELANELRTVIRKFSRRDERTSRNIKEKT